MPLVLSDNLILVLQGKVSKSASRPANTRPVKTQSSAHQYKIAKTLVVAPTRNARRRVRKKEERKKARLELELRSQQENAVERERQQALKRKNDEELYQRHSKKIRLGDAGASMKSHQTAETDFSETEGVVNQRSGSTQQRKTLVPKSPKAKLDGSSSADSPTKAHGDSSEEGPPESKPEPCLMELATETLENIFNRCDPISLTCLSLVNKRFSGICQKLQAVSPEFPVIKKKYNHDQERRVFMEHIHEFFPGMRYCYCCRKYKSIEGGTVYSYKNCPKKNEMADRVVNVPGNGPSGLTTKTVKVKPKPDEIVWDEDDWSTMVVGKIKSRRGVKETLDICPACTENMYTIHLPTDPATPIPRFIAMGNPLGGTMENGRVPPGCKPTWDPRRRLPGVGDEST